MLLQLYYLQTIIKKLHQECLLWAGWKSFAIANQMHGGPQKLFASLLIWGKVSVFSLIPFYSWPQRLDLWQKFLTLQFVMHMSTPSISHFCVLCDSKYCTCNGFCARHAKLWSAMWMICAAVLPSKINSTDDMVEDHSLKTQQLSTLAHVDLACVNSRLESLQSVH